MTVVGKRKEYESVGVKTKPWFADMEVEHEGFVCVPAQV